MLDLAHGIAGQSIEKNVLARRFKSGETREAVSFQRRGIELAARAAGDTGDGHFLPFRIRPPDDGGLRNVRVFQQRTLDLGGINILAA